MGFLAAYFSACFAAAKDLVSKRLSISLDGMSSTFASFAFPLPLYAVLLTALYALGYEEFNLTFAFFFLVFMRSTTDAFAEGFKMYALGYGDISLLSSFLSLSPVFLLFLSPVITGDSIHYVDVAAVLLVVGGGIVMVYRPGNTGWYRQKKGIILSVLASLFFALNNCFDRLAVQEGKLRLFGGLHDVKGTPVCAAAAMSLMSACFILPLIVTRRDRIASLALRAKGLWVRGLFEVLFMVSKLIALQTLTAPTVTVIQRFSLVLSIIGGRVFFREGDFARRLTAGTLIFLGVLFVVTYRLRPAP